MTRVTTLPLETYSLNWSIQASMQLTSLDVFQLCDAGKRTHFIFGKTTSFRKTNIPPAKKGIEITYLEEFLSNLNSEKHSFLSSVFSHNSKLRTHSLPLTYVAGLVSNRNLPRDGTDEITANITD